MAGSVINTFDKGLHQDSAFILQPDGTYRNMKNGMLISYDGNHYTVEMSKGNRVILPLPERYLKDNNNDADLKDLAPMPIGFISFIDKLVVFTTNYEADSKGGYGEIGVVSFTRVNNDFVASYVPYYHHSDLNFTKFHKIEGFSFKENDNIERVYWTDYFNEPRVFDIANPIFTTNIPSGSLVAGKKYMVLGGVIEHNGFWYGPSGGTVVPTAPNYVNGNIFELFIPVYNYTIVSGNPIVIEYYPLELLDWSPSRSLGSINFIEYGSGNKNCGSSIYFYRLSSSTGGFTTSWSYASSPIHIGMNNEAEFLTGVPYRDFVGNGNISTVFNSGKSVKIKIDGVDTNFDTIEIACAEFDQKTEIPYSINIISKTGITGSQMTFEDGGGTSLGTVTISDLTLFPASVLKIKTLSTNKNYNIIGNITEREEFNLDLSGVTLTQFNYPLIEHGGLDTCVNVGVPADQSPALGVNPGAGDIKPWSRYLVTNTSGGNVTYDSISYKLGDVFVGVVGQTSATIPVGSQCRPCSTRNKYTVSNSSSADYLKRRENAIELTTGFWNYKDPAIASNNRGYWSDERYPFGLLFFDLKGNPFYVKHISYFDFLNIYDKGGLMRNDAYGSSSVYSINATGINVSGLDIPESVMNKCSGFSIVRAERDQRIITQGLLTQTMVDPVSTPNRVYPIGIMDSAAGFTSSNVFYPDVYSYLCPDDLVGQEFKKPIGQVKSKMEEACWLDASDFRANGDDRNIYTKMFDTLSPDSNSPRRVELSSLNGSGFLRFSEYNGTPNFDGSGRDYFNRFGTVDTASVTGITNYTCSTASAWNGAIGLTVGCKKIVLKADGIPHRNQVLGYDNDANQFITDKLLFNCVSDVSKSNQYGGNSEAAIANILYISTGHFQPINDIVKADTLNGTFGSGEYTGQNKYTFNDIEVFGGDCYTNFIDLGYSLWDDTFNIAPLSSFAYSIWFPCECNTNYNLRRGLKVSNKDMYPNGLMSWDSSLGVKLENYSYNQGCTTEGDFIKYPALTLNYKFTGQFEYRVRWAGLKYPGELNDSFRTFSVGNYRDLDGKSGQINNLKTRDSNLFYWQDHGVGYTPILERQLVGGGALGDATALGVTGVIDRYDVIDTYFGNQHQHGLTETEYGFAWFDMRRRAFMVMGVGGKPEEMSMIKGLQVFFNSQFDEGDVFYPNGITLYNTNDLKIPEIPLLGYGIVGVYDPKFKMTYLTFKYNKRDNETDLDDNDYLVSINKDFTIGYNHILNAFVSFYDHCPAIWHNHNDLVLSSNNPKNTQNYNSEMLPNTSFVIGDAVNVSNVEYLCIKPVTIASYPGTLTPVTGTSPLAPSSQYWVAINKQNEVYIQTFGADICKFYGKVWDHTMEIVVNAKSDMAVTPQNIQFKSMGPNWTSLVASTEDQTASDLNISATNRNYRYIDKSWFSNIPLDKFKGRLTDYYVKLSFTFKNYNTDPRTSKNIQKVSQWLRTMFVIKR